MKTSNGSMRFVVISMVGASLLAACAEDSTARFDQPTALVAVGDSLAMRDVGGTIEIFAIDGSHRVRAGAGASAACDGDIHATAHDVYWRDCDRIWRADLDGANAAPMFETDGMSFVVDDAYLYGGLSNLIAYPLDGGPPEQRTTRDVVISSLALDGSDVYMGVGTAPFDEVLIGGIYRSEQRLIPDDTDVHLQLAAGEGTLAWSTREQTFRAALDGSGVVRIGIAARRGLQIAGGRIWWTTLDDDVVSVALDGSDFRLHYQGAAWLVGPALIGDRAYVLESDAERASRDQAYGPPTYHLIAIDL